MSALRIRMVTQDFDSLSALACGEVVPEGVELTLERDTRNALTMVLGDPTIDAGELSWSRHVARLAAGDRSFVAIPIFPFRAYRHRCFFVRRGSPLSELKHLEGKRVGTTEWPATGNVWARAALREAGVRIDGIRWMVGPVDGTLAVRPEGTLPPYVEPGPPGRMLLDLLLGGELDALMYPLPPAGYYQPDSPIVRLIPDYPPVERAYFQRTGLYPAHHIIGIRREVFERDPWVARSLFVALDRSKAIWQGRRRISETTPWLLAAIEEAMELMGMDWQPSGSEPNRAMTQTFCDEMYAQGLIGQPLDGAAVFADFDRVMAD